MQIQVYSDEAIARAVRILREDGLVAFPTETVYGLGANARSDHAIEKIFVAKQRPHQHPLIVHLADFSLSSEWAENIPPIAKQLAHLFLPGALTILFKKKRGVSDLLTGGQSTIGLRIPAHPVALSLLKAFGDGIAAPSANRFTRISPTNAQAVASEFPTEVDLIIDGGACSVGIESTIIDLSGELPVLRRHGMISRQEIELAIGQKLYLPDEVLAKAQVPGQHRVHYAPRTRTVLINSQAEIDSLPFQNGFFLHRQALKLTLPTGWVSLHMPLQAKEYAKALYQSLRQADEAGVACIAIERLPEESEWDAIRDRVSRASNRDVNLEKS